MVNENACSSFRTVCKVEGMPSTVTGPSPNIVVAAVDSLMACIGVVTRQETFRHLPHLPGRAHVGRWVGQVSTSACSHQACHPETTLPGEVSADNGHQSFPYPNKPLV